MITVPTKDVGYVRDRFTPQHEFVRRLEDFNEDYIKLNMGII